ICALPGNSWNFQLFLHRAIVSSHDDIDGRATARKAARPKLCRFSSKFIIAESSVNRRRNTDYPRTKPVGSRPRSIANAAAQAIGSNAGARRVRTEISSFD